MKTQLLALGLTVFAAAPSAQDSESLTVRTTAEKAELVPTEAGEELRLIPVEVVGIGDEIRYTVAFTNIGEQTAEGATVVHPVPGEMVYVSGSASGPGTEITFSVDEGRTFAPADALRVTEADGTERAAVAEDYTHIRWTMRHGLQSGATAFARFRALRGEVRGKR